jgi:hypothetical protein
LIIIVRLQKLLKQRIHMLSLNVVFEFDFLEVLATFSTLVHFLWAILEVEWQVSLLDSGRAPVWAVHLKLTDDFVKTHIWLEPGWQRFLAIRALFGPELSEAALADDGAALLAIEG